MAIIYNDNIQINAGKPIDYKYLSRDNVPYSGASELFTKIPISERYVGLTVNINNDEYWFVNGVAESDLKLKISSTGSITSTQNIGSGYGLYSGTSETGTLNLRSIIGSGSTDVSMSGDTLIVSSIPSETTLFDGILRYDSINQTYQPYSAYTSGTTFYYDNVSPSGTTKLKLNAILETTELSLSTGNTSHLNSHDTGDIFWDSDDSTMAIQLNENVCHQVGQEILDKARNTTAGLIPRGSVVYITGSVGGRGTIALARASSVDEGVVSHVIGVTTEDIAAGDLGFVTNLGSVRDLNTSGFTEGDIVFLSPVVWGGLINVKPEYPDFAIVVGIITNSDSIEGEMLVRIRDASQRQEIRGIEEVNAPFTATSRSDVLLVVGAGTYFLPASPKDGQHITFIDRDGDAGSFVIIVDGNGKSINNSSQVNLNTDYGSLTVTYSVVASRWYATTITP